MTNQDRDLDLLREYATQARFSLPDCENCRLRDRVICVLRERLRACGDEQGPNRAPVQETS